MIFYVNWDIIMGNNHSLRSSHGRRRNLFSPLGKQEVSVTGKYRKPRRGKMLQVRADFEKLPDNTPSKSDALTRHLAQYLSAQELPILFAAAPKLINRQLAQKSHGKTNGRR